MFHCMFSLAKYVKISTLSDVCQTVLRDGGRVEGWKREEWKGGWMEEKGGRAEGWKKKWKGGFYH